MSQESIIEQIKRFSPEIAEIEKPASTNIISEFEYYYTVILPLDYKNLLSTMNGFSIMGNEVYGISTNPDKPSLASVYEIEHYKVAIPQPSYYVPFSPDGGGNFYCFDTRYLTNDGRSCPVIFFVSNFEYLNDEQPEVVYDGFLDFVQERMINWVLEDYDYDGNER